MNTNKKYPPIEESGADIVSEPTMYSSNMAGALTPTQLYLLHFSARNPSEESAKEVQSAIFQYYQHKMDEQLNELWDNGTLDQSHLDQLRHMHIRDIIKQQA